MLNGIASRLERYMDLLAARQKVVASNIANADTPGYRTQDVDFQREFATLSQGEKPAVDEVPGLQAKTDGNNVSMDREARLLAENALRFNLASNLLRAQIQLVRSAIQEGRNG
jgi:flagellar basal-body rod protein FlgB